MTPQPDLEPVEPAEPAALTNTAVVTVSLSGDVVVPVPGTGLTAQISGSFHKVRAPLVGVSVLVSAGPDQQAEVSWRIESGVVNSQWLAVRGRRYDTATEAYKDEELPGWQVRLDSVDESSAGGDPRAITVSFEPVEGSQLSRP